MVKTAVPPFRAAGCCWVSFSQCIQITFVSIATTYLKRNVAIQNGKVAVFYILSFKNAPAAAIEYEN
jgi:hypothetical protein